VGNNLGDPVTVGIHKPIALDFAVYPNPASAKIWIEFTPPEAGLYMVTIINTAGQVIGKKEIRSTGMMARAQMDVSGLPQGCYHIRIIGKEILLNQVLMVTCDR